MDGRQDYRGLFTAGLYGNPPANTPGLLSPALGDNPGGLGSYPGPPAGLPPPPRPGPPDLAGSPSAGSGSAGAGVSSLSQSYQDRYLSQYGALHGSGELLNMRLKIILLLCK